MNKKLKKHLIILSLGAVILLLANFTYTFAKYIGSSIWDYHLKSKGFYFSSDDLKDLVQIDSWDGNSVYFSVKNSDNDALVTDYDINYEALCEVEGIASSSVECFLNGTSNNNVNGTIAAQQACFNDTLDGQDVSGYSKSDCEINGYIWEHQKAASTLYFTLTSNNPYYLIDDVTVKITVRSTSPYKKTLIGKYVLKKEAIAYEENVFLDYTDYENYGLLVVTNTYPTSKYVTVNWDSNNLLIDEDRTKFNYFETDSLGYINTIKFDIDAKTSKIYRFYKKIVDTYDVSEFSMGDGMPQFLPSYVAGVYQGNENNYLVGNVEWQDGRLLLDGINQGVEIPDNSNYEKGITMTMYFNRSSGVSAVQNLIMKRSTNMTGYFMYIDGGDNDKIKIDIGGAGANRITTPIIIENGIDYHVVYAWDPNEKGKLYLNGELIASYSNGNLVALNEAGNVPIKVGFDKDGVFSGNKYPFKGEIKAMNIYNEALTSDQVHNIYLRDTRGY